MIIKFTGNYVISSSITKDAEYVVEGVGTSIYLVDRATSTSAPYSFTAGKDYKWDDIPVVTVTSETDKERRDAYLARAEKYFAEGPNVFDQAENKEWIKNWRIWYWYRT